MRLRTLLALLATTLLLALPRAATAQDDRYRQKMSEGLRLLEAKDYDAAIARFKKCLELDAEPGLAYYNLACAYSLKGAKAEAIAWFEKSLAHGFREKAHIEQDADLDAVRDEPGFAAAMAKYFPGPPPGRLFTLKGDEVDLSPKGKVDVAVWMIWRSWAAPCREMIPALNDLARELGPKGLVIFAVSDEPAADQEKAAEELKIGPIVMFRSDGALAPREVFEGVREIFPTLVVVGRDGKVAKKLVGVRSKQELEAVLTPLFGTKRQSF